MIGTPQQKGTVMTRLQGNETAKNNGKQGRPRAGFARSEDGSLIIFGLMMFILILIVGGMAIDFMRFETQRTRLQETLDRAVLAAASLDQPLDPTDVVMDYVSRAGLGEYVNEDDIDVRSSPISRVVSVNASMGVQSFFLHLVGIDELTAPGASSAQQMASNTEVSLVLDVSGSMGNTASGTTDSRLEVLQEAAHTFVNMLMCDPTDPTKKTECTVPKGSVALHVVPYSEQVVAGEDLLDYLNVTDEHEYSSCVTWKYDSDFRSVGISSTTSLRRAGHFDAWTGYLRYTSSSDPASDWTCSLNPAREISYFEPEVGPLHDQIDALNADGNTSIDLGVKWGAALLDVDFKDVVEAMREDEVVDAVYDGYPLTPDPDDPEKVQKVIVLMTDGVNTSQHYLYDNYRTGNSPIFTSRNDDDPSDPRANRDSVYDSSRNRYYWPHIQYSDYYPQNRPYGSGDIPVCIDEPDESKPWRWNDSTKCSWVDAADLNLYATPLDYTEVWAKYPLSWWREWDFLPNPGSDYDNGDKNSRLSDICTAAKSEGIKIFTIGFDTGRTEERILKRCASETSYFFDANGLNLVTIFEMIAREVSKLKLVN